MWNMTMGGWRPAVATITARCTTDETLTAEHAEFAEVQDLKAIVTFVPS